MKKLLYVFFAAILCCMSCGSDDEPIPGGASGAAPQIANLTCDPDSAPAGGPSITMDCSLFFRDQDGDLETIEFSYIQGCGQDPGSLEIDVRGQSGVQEEGTIQLDNLIIRTSCPADIYTYGFVAVDGTRRRSPVETLAFELF